MDMILRKKTWLIISLSIVLSLIGGLAGAMLAKNYLIKNSSYYFGQEINSSQDNLRQANSIIENAKEVIAKQNGQTQKTIISAQNSLVGIFQKKEIPLSTENFNLASYYELNKNIGQGLIVTSDGWILATDFVKTNDKTLALKNFIAIDKDKNIYEIDKIIDSGIEPFLFVHLNQAKNLQVKNFSSKDNLSNGQSLLAIDWEGDNYLTSIINKNPKDLTIKDSETPNKDFLLSPGLENIFETAFIFNLDGEAVGFFDKKIGNISIDSFQPLINGLLEKTEKKLPFLGLNYVNLSKFAIKDVNYNQGALLTSATGKPAIIANSPADKAGLKAGDIILKINNFSIDNNEDLADIVSKYSAGDEITVIYRRGQNENSVNITLQELKK